MFTDVIGNGHRLRKRCVAVDPFRRELRTKPPQKIAFIHNWPEQGASKPGQNGEMGQSRSTIQESIDPVNRLADQNSQRRQDEYKIVLPEIKPGRKGDDGSQK